MLVLTTSWRESSLCLEKIARLDPTLWGPGSVSITELQIPSATGIAGLIARQNGSDME